MSVRRFCCRSIRLLALPVDGGDGQGAQDTRHGQADDEEKRAAVRAAGVVQRAGDGAAEAGEDQVAVDQGEIYRVAGRAEIGAAEGGVGGRDAGVGQAADDEADDDHHHAAAGHGQKQHHGGEDEQAVHQLHGQAAAKLVVHTAEQHTAHGVADGDQAHDGGHRGGGLVGAGLPHHAAGLGDQGQPGGADGDGPDVVQPKGGALEHDGGLDVLPGRGHGPAALAGGNGEVRAGRDEEEGAHRQHHAADDAQHHEAGAPAADTGGRPGLVELADEEAAAAEAHEQHAGDQARLVGKPLDHGAHHAVVGKAGGQAAQQAEAQVQRDGGLAAAGDEEAGQEQHGADAHGVFGAELARQQAAQQRADAEQDHDQGERQAQLCLGPAGELGGDGRAEHAPGVDQAREQQHDHAHDGVDPAVELLHV